VVAGGEARAEAGGRVTEQPDTQAPAAPELSPEDLQALARTLPRGMRHKLEQRKAEKSKDIVFLPVVLVEGSPDVAPLIGLPISKALYEVKKHQVPDEKLGFRTVYQYVRCGRGPKLSKKQRLAARRAERSMLAKAGS
jgi:hypothetical protein